LRDIRVGDDVFVETPAGRIRYSVSWFRVVAPKEVSVLHPTEDDVVTLITCYPFWALGPAPDRLVVRATRAAAARPVTLVTEDQGDGRETPPASAPRVIARDRPAPRAGARPADDETLVRQTIETFRVTYNARLVRHAEDSRDGLLAFEACDIAVAGDGGSAWCRAASAEAADAVPKVWTLALERNEGRWAITSVQSP
jgi:hypothetical protein